MLALTMKVFRIIAMKCLCKTSNTTTVNSKTLGKDTAKMYSIYSHTDKKAQVY